MASMFAPWLSRICSWPAVRRVAQWRRDLLFHVFTWEKDDLAFFSLLGCFVVLLCGLVYFTYADHLDKTAERQRQTDLTCLARNVYFEARGESIAGQHAVAEVTLNRVASTRFPGSVCEVVYEKRWDRLRRRYVGAFSWTELDAAARVKGVAWQQAVAVARTIYDSKPAPTVQGALFYHADSIEPRWASTKKKVAKIGRHIFYE